MFMMRITDSDRSNSDRDISSILELTGSVFIPGKSRWQKSFKRMRTSLQSFRLLPQNLCKAHLVRAAEITRMSLQLFSEVLVYDYYFVLFEARDCVLHIQDDFSGTPSDTRVQDDYPSSAYCEPSVKNDTLNFFWLLP